jgi:hypothetical protein
VRGRYYLWTPPSECHNSLNEWRPRPLGNGDGYEIGAVLPWGRERPRFYHLLILRHDFLTILVNALGWQLLFVSPISGACCGGIQYVEHTEGDGERMFAAVCKLGLEGIVGKRLTSVYKSGPSKTWIKVKNPKSPAATRVIDGTF